MKNKLLIALTSLLAVTAFVGCDAIEARPSNGKDALVEIENTNYFQNNYQKVYDQLVSSGNLTSLTFKKLIKTIVENEVDQSSFFENLDQLKQELIDEEMLTKVSSSSYAKDGKFYESKLIESLANSLYVIQKDGNHEGIYIKPDSTVIDVLGDGYCKYENGQLTGRYAEYVEKEILPEINQKLLTVKYICENEFSALGRAYARRVNYVKLTNISKQPGAASRLITKWLTDWIETGKNSSAQDVLDLDSLARIWKGVNLTAEEEAYVEANNVYTLKDEIEDEIKKVAVCDDTTGELVLDANGNFTMLADSEIDTSIESKYTGSNTYPLAVGYEKALRDLSAKQLSDTDLYTKTNGISGLPSTITERVFSPSVASYVKESHNVKFLFPAKTETGSTISQYYFYESGEDAYYIVTIDNYDYSSSTLKNAATKDEDGNVTKVTNEIARIALELASSSTYKSKALIDVFEKYELGEKKFYKSENIHDQTFYDYMESNYGDIFED